MTTIFGAEIKMLQSPVVMFVENNQTVLTMTFMSSETGIKLPSFKIFVQYLST